MKNFGKYLLLIFVFLSIGAGSTYANSTAELREVHPISSEDVRVAGPVLWAFRENPFQEILDLSENELFGNISGIPRSINYLTIPATTNLTSGHKRDLRHILFQQIFPKHFFL